MIRLNSAMIAFALILTVIGLEQLAAQDTDPYDIVIRGGRVVDPESGFDGIANVGIRGDRIAAVT